MRLLAATQDGLTAGAGADDGLSTRTAVSSAASTPARHEQPVVFGPGSATLRPEVLDALTALVVRIGHDTAITAVGHSDGSRGDALATLRAEALRNALLARGVPAGHIRMVDDEPAGDGRSHASVLRWTGAVVGPALKAGQEPPTPFDITLADRDIAVSLRRWARASGYDLVWDVGWVAPVNGAMRVEAPSFPEAVQQVVAGLRSQGYPVRVQADADHAVRFTASE